MKIIFICLSFTFGNVALADAVNIQNPIVRGSDGSAQLLAPLRFSDNTVQSTAAAAPGAATWGNISGILSDQTDLQSILNGKQPSLGFTPANVADNLSDLLSPSTARTNLGLGTAATTDASAYDVSGAAASAQAAAQAASDPSGSAATAQAFAVQRANHTGTQLAATISDFASAVVTAMGFNKAYVDATIGGFPSGVIPTMGNKIQYDLTKDGLFIQSFNTPAFTSGAFNGGGTGSKAILGFNNYNNLAFSSFTALGFTAKNIRDEFASALSGNAYFNMLANFNSGALTLANDYVNIGMDCAAQISSSSNKYCSIPRGSYETYSVDMTNERSWKAVGGTGVITGTGSCTIGSPIITAISNATSLTVGMFFRINFTNTPGTDTTCIPDGSKIISIDTVGNTVTLDHNATSTAATQTTKQYGGVAPVSRSGVCTGTTTITGITNTADLQANMLVNDGGTDVPAHSFIVSMVANTSITLNNSCTTGNPALNFVAAGKTGIPPNSETVAAVTWASITANNPNGYFANTAPTVAGGWTAADGGWPKNAVQSAFNFVQGGSSSLDSRINALKSVTINSDVYTFAR